jgi:tetratricopeptide (TPR) repeat protein/predicted Ser/Thr protein kinase
MNCPDENAIVGFMDGTLSSEERAALAGHADGCRDCRDLLARLSDDPVVRASADPFDAASRFILLSTLGAGGMGVVHAAFDRHLDRKVALKFLGSEPVEDLERARARLQREAQALAQLAHPNVITVHDVGVLEGEVFLAMELVEGPTLRAWLGTPRSLSEILEVFRQAGEGLAAAHASGIVHRDFKPENVLVGDDGRVRVTDFGLARALSQPDLASAEGTLGIGVPGSLTRTGLRAGTPAYMSPEQRLTGSADARSDIYSFCVALHEAVTGERPEAGARPGRRAPGWLERILDRGLQAEPDQRWPSMADLLQALARGPWLTPLRIGAGMGAALVLAAAAVVIAHRDRSPVVCAVDPSTFAGVWDSDRRESVRAAFESIDPKTGSLAVKAVDAALERFRTQWLAMRAESCAATLIKREQSQAVLDLRTACLDEELHAVDAQVQVFEHADAQVLERSFTAVADLPNVNDCLKVKALQAIDPLPKEPQRMAPLAKAQALLERAQAMTNVGKDVEALQLVDSAQPLVRAANYPPLEARMLVLKAHSIRSLGNPADVTARAAHEAAEKAMEARDDASAASAWIILARNNSSVRTEGYQWSEYALAAIKRMGGNDGLEGEALITLAVAKEYNGELDDAQALFERARPLVIRAHGPDYYRVASIDDGLGTIAFFEQRFDDALRLIRQALALRERVMAPDQGAIIVSILNEQDVLVDQGRFDEAEKRLRQADAMLKESPDDKGNMVAYLHWCWGTYHRRKGQLKTALEEDQASVAAYRPALDAADAMLARPLTGVGLDLLGLKRPAEAIAPLEEAVRLFEGAGSTAPELSDARFALARALDGANPSDARALALARQAHSVLAPFASRWGGDYQVGSREIEAWLGARSITP